MEEHRAVGKGFDAIAALWGRFSELMAHARADAETATRADEGEP